MIAKVHMVNGEKMVAVCDEGLLGKKFEEGDLQIDLTGDFYRGEKVSEQELDVLLKEAFVLDFVGEKSIEFAKKDGLIDGANTVVVKNIPHAQIFVI